MAQAPVDFEEIRDIVQSLPMTREEAENLAHYATCEILDCGTGARLCAALAVALEAIPAGDWLGRDVGDRLREEAMELVSRIERASHANDNGGRSDLDFGTYFPWSGRNH